MHQDTRGGDIDLRPSGLERRTMLMDFIKRTRGVPVVAVLVLLTSGCLKDGVLPTKQATEGDVSLRVEFVNGTRPFSAGMWGVDGTGAQIRFTTLKFYLSDIGLYDIDSNRIGGIVNSELLLDASRSGVRYSLGRIPNGHIEEFRFVPGLDRSFSCEAAFPNGHPYTDPSMHDQDDMERMHLHMAGYVDVNNDGHFDEGVDVAFDHALKGGTPRPLRHFHMHADMIDGQPLELGIQVDLRILLLAVDMGANPTSTGNDALVDLLLNNLAIAISPL